MRNPLRKRYPRELIGSFGKYLAIFLLMVLTISEVSGFMVADGSLMKAYDESFEKYNIEDGHFALEKKADEETKDEIEEFGVSLYDLFYTDVELTGSQTLRIYQNREEVDQVCLMEGELPKDTSEIAIDRMFADNNTLTVGDEISDGEHTWKITGLVALSDYSTMFENNTDMMFDSLQFGVAIVTEEAFSEFKDTVLTWNYAWKYETESAAANQASVQTEAGEGAAKNGTVDSSGEVSSAALTEQERAEALMKKINSIAALTDFVPRYENQAIVFTGDDMSGDFFMIEILLYVMIAVLAFVFAVTISNTITAEAGVIGTLRASGYTRAELLRHYMAVPLLVTLAAALVGNVLGYTVFKDINAGLYYASYSLPTYETIWNAQAFVLTTVVPLIMMVVITGLILKRKLKLPIMRFLRRELGGGRLRRALRLPHAMPFFTRFSLRVIWQNLGSCLVMFAGIFFASFLLMFGLSLPALMDSYQAEITSNMLAKYQYILKLSAADMAADEDNLLQSLGMMLKYKVQLSTSNEDAESFSATTLNTPGGNGWRVDEIMVYGLNPDSRYVEIDTAPLGEGEVYISDLYAQKYQLKEGDSFTLTEEYGDQNYTFTVAGIYDYTAAMTVFMDRAALNELMGWPEEFFVGYFSDSEITDIDSDYISTVIDEDALTKVTRQLTVSMGSMMDALSAVSVIMFIILVSVLVRVILEKNAQSISLTKILGYRSREVGRLYLLPISLMVIVLTAVSIPLSGASLIKACRVYMPLEMTGWIPLKIPGHVWREMVLFSLAAYAVVLLIEYRRIKRVPMDQALKNVE